MKCEAPKRREASHVSLILSIRFGGESVVFQVARFMLLENLEHETSNANIKPLAEILHALASDSKAPLAAFLNSLLGTFVNVRILLYRP